MKLSTKKKFVSMVAVIATAYAIHLAGLELSTGFLAAIMLGPMIVAAVDTLVK